jgi:hypothetical protein
MYRVNIITQRDSESHQEFMDRINRVLKDFNGSIEVISIAINNKDAVVLYRTKGAGVPSEVDLPAESPD